MNKNNIVNLVTEFSTPIVEEMGYKLIKIEYIKENNTWILRIYIDKKGGITIEDCEHVSNTIGDRLDELDVIPQRYCLEVSSAGERELQNVEDIKMHLNENSIVKLINGDLIEGILNNAEDNIIYLSVGDNIKAIQMENIKKIKLKFIF